MRVQAHISAFVFSCDTTDSRMAVWPIFLLFFLSIFLVLFFLSIFLVLFDHLHWARHSHTDLMTLTHLKVKRLNDVVFSTFAWRSLFASFLFIFCIHSTYAYKPIKIRFGPKLIILMVSTCCGVYICDKAGGRHKGVASVQTVMKNNWLDSPATSLVRRGKNTRTDAVQYQKKRVWLAREVSESVLWKGGHTGSLFWGYSKRLSSLCLFWMPCSGCDNRALLWQLEVLLTRLKF